VADTGEPGSRANRARVQVSGVSSELDGSLSEEEAELVDYAAAVPAGTWFAVSNWAKETGNLQSWQRSLAYSLES